LSINPDSLIIFVATAVNLTSRNVLIGSVSGVPNCSSNHLSVFPSEHYLSVSLHPVSSTVTEVEF
jgi:hypothetical protein